MTQKTRRHDTPIAILPPVDNLPFSQNIGQAGRDGTPHKPLFPERLSKTNQIEDKKDIISI